MLAILTRIVSVCIGTNTCPKYLKDICLKPLPKTVTPKGMKDLRPINILLIEASQSKRRLSRFKAISSV